MDPRQTAETFNTIQPYLFWIVALVTAFCAVATVIAQNIVRSATWLLFTLAGTSAVFFLLGADLVGVTQLLVYVGGTLVLVIFGVMLTAQGPFISMKTSGAEWAISVVAGLLLMGVLATAVLTPNVSAIRPLVRTNQVAVEGPLKGEKVLMYRTPEVRRYAPLFSRAERQIKGAKAPPAVIGPKGLPTPPGAGGAPQLAAPKADAEAVGQGGKPPMPPIEVKKVEGPPPLEIKPEPLMPLDPATSAQSVTLGEGFIGVPVGPAHPSSRGIVRTSYLLPFEIVSIHLLVVLIGAAYLARAKRRREGVS